MTANSISRFLVARLDADERMYREFSDLIPDAAWHLADIAVKRALLDLHLEGDDGRCGECSDKFCVTPWNDVCEVAAILASMYTYHPDYREEWKP